MKKIIAIVLLVSLSLSFLSGCTETGEPFNVTVTGTTETLIKPIKSSYRAGERVRIQASPVTDASLHVFVDGEEIPMSDTASKYCTYSFVMPAKDITIHLTFDRFYGRDEYQFDELCHWLKHEEIDVNKVSIRTSNVKEKYSFIETRYSTKQEDIENFEAILNQKLIKVDNSAFSDIDYLKVYGFSYNSQYNGNRSGSLVFYDELYYWYDFSSSQFFKLEDENFVLPVIENPDLVTYSFDYDGRSSDVKKYDDPSVCMYFFNLNQVEFVPYTGEAIDIEPVYYIDSRYGIINLLNATIFELDGQYYEIVSGDIYWAYRYLELDKK